MGATAVKGTSRTFKYTTPTVKQAGCAIMQAYRTLKKKKKAKLHYLSAGFTVHP